MTEIIALFQCIEQTVSSTTLKQLTNVVTAILAMTGRVTMLNISRWCEQGGSYRTVQRLYNTTIAWTQLNWQVVKNHVWDGETALLLAGDETIVTKAGKETHGVDRFFSSLAGRVVPSLSFFAIAVINPQKRTSSVLRMAQLSREQSTTGRSRPKEQNPVDKKRRKRGRPKGSKNKNRRDVTLPTHLVNLQEMFMSVLKVVGDRAQIGYLLLDGAFGNNNAVQMATRCRLHLVSKLRRDAALYVPYSGEQKKQGRRRQYGDRLNYANLPADLCVSDQTNDGVNTRIYQVTCWHKRFADQLNIVVIVKVNLQTQQRAHVILFTTDLALAWETLIDYYKLRFQIEFNFRDAKQFWGLEDFMNIRQRPVHNAANLAMFMGNVAQALFALRGDNRHSILDLKAHYRGLWYARQLLNWLPDTLDPLFIQQFFAKAGILGAIHAADS